MVGDLTLKVIYIVLKTDQIKRLIFYVIYLLKGTEYVMSSEPPVMEGHQVLFTTVPLHRQSEKKQLSFFFL